MFCWKIKKETIFRKFLVAFLLLIYHISFKINLKVEKSSKLRKCLIFLEKDFVFSDKDKMLKRSEFLEFKYFPWKLFWLLLFFSDFTFKLYNLLTKVMCIWDSSFLFFFFSRERRSESSKKSPLWGIRLGWRWW